MRQLAILVGAMKYLVYQAPVPGGPQPPRKGKLVASFDTREEADTYIGRLRNVPYHLFLLDGESNYTQLEQGWK